MFVCVTGMRIKYSIFVIRKKSRRGEHTIIVGECINTFYRGFSLVWV